eukprot:g79394.t1
MSIPRFLALPLSWFNISVSSSCSLSCVPLACLLQDQRTALMFAAIGGSTELGQLLLEGKADLHAADKQHMTALLLAAKQGNTALGKVLVEGKADVNVKSKEQLTALLYAAKQGNTALGQALVEGKADLNVMDQENMTALLLAAKQGNTALGKVLVEGKADVNVKSKEQLTALLYAAKQGNTALGKVLMEGKAELNVTDQAGRSALYCAADDGHFDIVELLLRHRADWRLPHQDGSTAKGVALKKGHTAIFETLRRADEEDAKSSKGSVVAAKQESGKMLGSAEVQQRLTVLRAQRRKLRYFAFLSHMQAEAAPHCMLLNKELALNQVLVWYDNAVETSRLDMVGMLEAVAHSACILLYVTKSYLTRPWCQFELGCARALEVPVVVVLECAGPFAWTFQELLQAEPALESHEILKTPSSAKLYDSWVAVSVAQRLQAEMREALKKGHLDEAKRPVPPGQQLDAAAVRAELAELKAAADKTQGELAELKATADKTQGELKVAADKTQGELAELRATADKTQGELKAAADKTQGELAKLRAAVSKSQGELAAVQGELAALREEVRAGMAAGMAVLREEVQGLQAAILASLAGAAPPVHR